MAKLPSVGYRKVVKAFEWLGWREVRQSGGHIILTKEGSVATLSVPAHKSVSKGVLRSLIRNAGITVNEFVAVM